MEPDGFGTAKLFRSAVNGRTWESNWGNGEPREIQRTNVNDPGLVVRGKKPFLYIDGAGVAMLGGEQPRLYVYEDGLTWQNVEITFYAQRVTECAIVSSQGFVAGARSEHQAVTDRSLCPGFAYYGRMLYSGRANFQKELSHGSYSPNLPSDGYRIDWGTENGQIPTRRWIGYKCVIRNRSASTEVQLELYRDLAEGTNGGQWELLFPPVIDQGRWFVADPNVNCTYPPNQILTEPATSVFVRNTSIFQAKYRSFSVREIEPLP